MKPPPQATAQPMPTWVPLPFVLGTFALTLDILGSYILSHKATWAPAIAAVTLILVRSGWRGRRVVLSRRLLRRCARSGGCSSSLGCR
ncbi:hypothetical protein SAMN05444722_1832 [Rhodovulum sp. ES.010]|nr:hypothetical protein SAMN05444722_1832 [Rhodovulum sp. ES.010]